MSDHQVHDVVVHQGALGDWVLTWPLLRGLGRAMVVTAASKGKLAARVIGGLTAVDVEGREWAGLYGQGDTRTEARSPWREARRVVSFVSSGRDVWAANVRRLAPQAQLAFVQPRPPRDWPGHVCDFHQQQLRQQGFDVPYLDPPPRQRSDGPIVIHPGSGGRDKVWPLGRVEQLIDLLRQRGHEVQCVVGEVESERVAPDVLQRLQARSLATLDELADCLLGAKLVIGNDSGPTHLSAQLGLPTLALFGPSDARQWSPRGPRVRLLAPPSPQPMPWLGVATVLEAALGLV